MINKKLFSTGLCWLWISLLILIIDFCSKQFIINNFWIGKSVTVFFFINFTYIQNSGAAFGFLANETGWQVCFLSITTLIIIIILLIRMHYIANNIILLNLSYAMIIGGAAGNLLDRVIYGVVIDFIDCYIGNWHWPIFNIADLSICIGSICIFFNKIFVDLKNKNSKNKVIS